MSPKAMLTPEQIENFMDTGVEKGKAIIEQANTDGMWATVKIRSGYRQEFDIESDKGIGGEAKAKLQPGVTVLDSDADFKAKIGVTKDREGYAETVQEIEFRSKIAAEEMKK